MPRPSPRLITRDALLARIGGRILTAAAIAARIKSAVKYRVDRTRPRAVDDGEFYEMRYSANGGSDHGSFPSGRAPGAVAVARDHAGHRLVAYSAAAAAIALVQIPHGKHYPSDLIAGASWGVVAEGIARTGELC